MATKNDPTVGNWARKLGLVAIGIFALSFLGSRLAVFASKFVTGDPGWAQAIGSVLAILAGFAGVLYQVGQSKADAKEQRDERGRAAHLLAYDAFETVTERLQAMLKASRAYPTHRLRGERTNEMIAAMREIDTSTLPPIMLADFIRLRSRVFAINQRITEIYKSEEKTSNGNSGRNKGERRKRLNSAVQVWKEALTYFDNIQTTATGIGGSPQDLTKPVEITGYAYPDTQIFPRRSVLKRISETLIK
ncbi:hypothetical protein [Sphingomonas sp. PP-CC-3A-396]|uniref:hypothetical protein n=1 Tax=Sphingomonas sp. PP-CC-3A-396 TaxID=2135655 RepID=UPI0010540162|nr:hypothetical protein [Sphingomonas sp. PP-CC-3A-396]TCQ02467.1 hypothetical protein C8J40_1172 [Sphingomonas sp. PP-CC-3A-396]